MLFWILQYPSPKLSNSACSRYHAREIPQSSVVQHIGICHIFSSHAVLRSKLLTSSSTLVHISDETAATSPAFAVNIHPISRSTPAHCISVWFICGMFANRTKEAGLSVIFRAGVGVVKQRRCYLRLVRLQQHLINEQCSVQRHDLSCPQRLTFWCKLLCGQ